MEDPLNPFEQDTFLDVVGSSKESSAEPSKLSLDFVAKRLLDDGFILTALELHTELLESGRELKRLRDYFSNPSNFEIESRQRNEVSTSSGAVLGRTQSVTTFDSFDEVTPSEDGERLSEDKLAILEFQLRKSKETIRELRQQLTEFSEQDNLLTPSIGETCNSATGNAGRTLKTEAEMKQTVAGGPLRQHERRTLNFLVNEYLQQNDYKITAVTFSDEVGNQDFEVWDDVGLNVARPSDLATLYREFAHLNNGFVNTKDVACMADVDSLYNPFIDSPEERENVSALLNRLNDENSELLHKNQILEGQVAQLEQDILALNKSRDELSNANVQNNIGIAQNPCDPAPSSHHGLPFIIGNSAPGKQNLIPFSDGNFASHHFWEVKRTVPPLFKQMVTQLAVRTCGSNNLFTHLLRINLSTNAKDSESNLNLVLLITECSLKLAPHILATNRDALIPLLCCSAMLHPDIRERDRILQCLFALFKKPDEEQRALVLTGCAVYAQRVGPVRTEAELLPHLWEQINHKCIERRLLVAEACGVLAPYIPPSLLSSLALSMLQQLLSEDKSEIVREAAVKALAVLCLFIDDTDKMNKVSELLQKALSDSFEVVLHATQLILLPAFAQWTFECGKLQLGVAGLLIKRLSNVLQTWSSSSYSSLEPLVCSYFESLRNICPILYWSVITSLPAEHEAKALENYSNVPIPSHRYPPCQIQLDNLLCYANNSEQLQVLTGAFDAVVTQEWFQTWDCLDFIIRDFVPGLVSVLQKLDVTLIRSVHTAITFLTHFCRYFGKAFSMSKVRPIFTAALTVPSETLQSHPHGHFAISSALFPTFVCGVLAAFGDDADSDRKELVQYLRTTVVQYAACAGFGHTIATSFAELSICCKDFNFLLTLAWEFVVHNSIAVRQVSAAILAQLARIASESVLKAKVVPALITLASESELEVRTSTIVGFGTVIVRTDLTSTELSEKIKMQLASFLEDTQHLLLCLGTIKMLASVAPLVDAKFRDEFVIPRLAIMAAQNNHQPDANVRRSISQALFEAYSALSCCFLPPAIVCSDFLPGLKSLQRDCDAEHANIVASICKDFEAKVGIGAAEPGGDYGSGLGASGQLQPGELPSVDVMKTKMMGKFKDLRERMDQTKDAVPTLFKKK